MEEEREDRLLQVVCCRTGDKMGELELEDKKTEDHLSDSLTNVASGFPGRALRVLVGQRDGVKKEGCGRSSA